MKYDDEGGGDFYGFKNVWGHTWPHFWPRSRSWLLQACQNVLQNVRPPKCIGNCEGVEYIGKCEDLHILARVRMSNITADVRMCKSKYAHVRIF